MLMLYRTTGSVAPYNSNRGDTLENNYYFTQSGILENTDGDALWIIAVSSSRTLLKTQVVLPYRPDALWSSIRRWCFLKQQQVLLLYRTIVIHGRTLQFVHEQLILNTSKNRENLVLHEARDLSLQFCYGKSLLKIMMSYSKPVLTSVEEYMCDNTRLDPVITKFCVTRVSRVRSLHIAKIFDLIICGCQGFGLITSTAFAKWTAWFFIAGCIGNDHSQGGLPVF